MKNNRINQLLLLACASQSLLGCAQETLIRPIEANFDFDVLNEVIYEVNDSFGDITHLSGNNIADGDYRIDGDLLSIEKNYLISLKPGTYNFDVFSSEREEKISLNVLDCHNENRLPNNGFETGDFFAWESSTAFKGETNLQVFSGQAVVVNNQIGASEEMYEGDGEYVYGLPADFDRSVWEEKMGRLTSRPFVLGGSGFVTFKLGGAKNADLTYLRFIDYQTREEIARFGNHLFDSTLNGLLPAQLHLYRADLSAHLGKTVMIEIVDLGGRAWDFICVDTIETYYANVPEEGTEAQNIMPISSKSYAPNQLVNGDFSQGLDNWTISPLDGWHKEDGTSQTWTVDGRVLKSNLGGDGSRGLIRSSFFRVDGSGVVSLSLGAAQGSRFDKDTVVSIKERNTNLEIARFANSRHDGIFMVDYYVDLSDFMNRIMYFEIYDNATGSYDTIFVEDIITYYAERPAFTYGESAININY